MRPGTMHTFLRGVRLAIHIAQAEQVRAALAWANAMFSGAVYKPSQSSLLNSITPYHGHPSRIPTALVGLYTALV